MATTSTTADGNLHITKYDDLGREITKGSKNINGIWSYVKTLYDIYDRKISIGEPVTTIGGTPTQSTTSSFDDYGRVVRVVEHTGKTTILHILIPVNFRN